MSTSTFAVRRRRGVAIATSIGLLSLGLTAEGTATFTGTVTTSDGSKISGLNFKLESGNGPSIMVNNADDVSISESHFDLIQTGGSPTPFG